MFELTSVGMAQADPVTRTFMYVNAAFCEMTGYSRAELLGMTVDQLSHPDDHDREAELYQRLIGGQSAYEIEKRYVRKDGSIVWVVVTGNVIRDANGCPQRAFALVQDITSRKQAEEMLRQSEADARLLQKLSAELVVQDDTATLYQEIADGASALMRSQFASMQMLHPANDDSGVLKLLAFRGFTPQAAEHWNTVAGGLEGTSCGRALRIRERVVVPDVENCDFISSQDLAVCRAVGIRACQTTPLVARNGNLIGMLSTHWSYPHEPSERELLNIDILARQAADLIDRKMSQVRDAEREVEARKAIEGSWAATEEQKRLLQSITDNATTALFILDERRQCTYMNPAAERLTGYTLAETRGRSLHEVLHHTRPDGSPYPAGECPIHRALPQNDREQGEEVFVHKDGRFYYVAFTASPVREENGKPVGTIVEVQDISERKKAELAMRRVTQSLALAMRGGRMGWWSREVSSGVVQWSPELEEIFGLPHGGFPGTEAAFFELIHPEDRAGVGAEVQEAVAQRCDYFIVFRYRHADGSWRWMEGRGRALYDDGGAPQWLYGIGIDITDRKRTEELAQERQRLLQSVFESSPAIIYIKDRDGTLLMVNRRFCELAGRPAEEIVGRRDREIFSDPGALDAILENDRQVFLRDRMCEFEEVMTFADGTHTFISTKVPVEGIGFPDKVLVGITIDITDRKRAEEARRESEQRFRVALEHTPILVYEVDCELRYRWIYNNPARYGGRDVLRMRDDEILPREDVAELMALKEKVLASGVGARREIRLPFAGRIEFWEVNAEPLREQDGSISGLIVAAMDITERKEAEEALREADRRKDEFLATLAHELRNPLAPVTNSLHILHRVGADAVERHRFLEMIERQVSHMVRLVDDLLEVSRITRGKIELRKEIVDLAAVVRSAVEAAGPLVESSGHEFTITLPSEAVMLEADPVRLAQVIANLLNNAAKYTEQGGRIWLEARREQDMAVVSVRDTGMGIPVEMLPRVFELFTQIDRTLGRAQGGLGIGLALVKQMVEMHAGSVEATSDGIGKGSEFTIRLPVAKESPRQLFVTAGDNGRPASGLGLRVLVVDDNHDAAESLSMLMQMMGNETRVAYEGLEAETMTGEFRPDVVLLDIGLPVRDGYEVARNIRALPWGDSIALVAVTGWGQEEDRRRAKEAGFDAHLVKPVDPDALTRLLASLKTQRLAC